MSKFLYIYIFMLFIFNSLHSQTTISGIVKDTLENAVSGVSITYSKPHTASILGFTRSNDKGFFELKINTSLDSIQLNFNHLTFGKRSLITANKNTENLIVELSERSSELKDVIVEASPIYKRGDTINYSVGAFTSKDDRVIGDIIKKLPGIEMQGSQILYQGKPIQKYSIDGLDLLEGRYSMANENMPADAVQTVQVIENDQPIKILDSLVFSDRASLNIKLKKFITTGSGKIGIGANPLLWDVNLTPMTFNKTFQTINSYQTNNVGDDVSRQLETYSFGSSFDADVPESRIAFAKSFINLHGIITPPFEQKRWLRNNIHMLSSNVLKKFKNDVELKGNISFINDYQQQASFARSVITTPAQTIEMTEDLTNNFNVNDLRGNISLVNNEKEIYLRNKISFGKRWNNDVGNLVRNNTDNIHQYKKLNNIYFANKLSAAKFLGKQLVNISSYIHYAETPQTLSITPGQFENILNNGNAYDKVHQQVFYKTFSTDNFLSFAKGFKGIALMPKLGVSFDRNNTQSEIATFEENVSTQLADGFLNDIIFNNTNLYGNLGVQYRKNRWRIDMRIPLNFSFYNIDNRNASKNINKVFVYSNPGGYMIYQLSNNWETTLSSNYSNSFGGSDQMYTAYLLSSYRNIQRYNTDIPRGRNWLSGVAFNYKNTLKATFANIYLAYSKGSNDFTYKTDIDADGLNTINLVQHKSYRSSQIVNADISRFIVKWKTTVKLKSRTSLSQSEQIINGTLDKLHTQQFSGGLELSNTLLDYMLFSYEGNINFFRNKLGNTQLTEVNTQKHRLNASIYPVDNHSVSVNTEYYYNNLQSTKSQIFLDLVYRWAFPKKKVDIELACNNLLNNKTFYSVYTSDYTIIENSFEMRPRQFLASVKFRF